MIVFEYCADCFVKNSWRAFSLVKCDDCGKERMVRRSLVRRKQQIAYCNKCCYKYRNNKNQKTSIDYINLAKEKNIIFVGPPPDTAINHTYWKCGFGHEIIASYQNIAKRNNICFQCKNPSIKLNEKMFHDLANEKGIKFIGPLVTKQTLKTVWMCNCGQHITKDFASIQKNSIRCRKCISNLKKEIQRQIMKERRFQEYQTFKQNTGFYLVDEENVTINKAKWITPEGNQIITKQSFIKEFLLGKRSSLEPIHSRYNKLDSLHLDFNYLELARQNNLQFIGPNPNSVHILTNWICHCGKHFLNTYACLKHSKYRRCYDCYLAMHKGPNHPSYNFYLSEKERLKKRNFPGTNSFRRNVLIRDNFQCQNCKNSHTSLNVHHIFNWNQYKDLRFNVNNGITLCSLCHSTFHKKYNKQNNTLLQIEEFIGKQLPVSQKEVLLNFFDFNCATNIRKPFA